MIFIAGGWALQKIATSSAKIKWVSFKALQWGWKANPG